MGSEIKRFVGRLSIPVGLFVESVIQSPRFSSTRSMRRSGMKQTNATNTYKPMEIRGLTNASGIAMKSSTGESLPFQSPPIADARMEFRP